MLNKGDANIIFSYFINFDSKHESRQRILSKNKKRKREEGKSPFLKGY